MMKENKDIVCFHKSCSDGFTSAYIAKLWYEKCGLPLPEFVEVIPRIKPNVSVDGCRVVMFDVCLNRDDLLDWKKRAFSFKVYDHHDTNMKDLADLKFCYFNMDMSGAGLAWEFYFGGIEPPWWVSYTQDRDLWTWKLPSSREVNAYLISLDLTFASYSQLKEVTLEQALQAGRELLRSDNTKIQRTLKYAHLVDFVLPKSAERVTIPVVNSPAFQSELGNLLAANSEFSVVWYTLVDEVSGELIAQLSFRSVGDFHVGLLAKEFGGGGHKNSAGCRMPLKQWMQILNTAKPMDFTGYAE